MGRVSRRTPCHARARSDAEGSDRGRATLLSGFILDASIALAWHFDDERDATADIADLRADAEAVHVPVHWFAEVANGLLMGERRGRTDAARVASFLDRLRLLDLVSDAVEGPDTFARVLPLAQVHRLTVYDALYLDLARRTRLPLATLDRALGAAAREAGVALIGDEA